jgi:ABC-type molybdate transport system substrate-binding protein
MTMASNIRALAASAVMLAVALAGAAARADGYVAPDVVVLAEPTLVPALASVAAAWRRESGVPVHIFASPTDLLVEQIAHGVRSDIVVGEGDAALSGALARQLLKPAPRGGGWRNRLVVARRTADRAPIALARGADLAAMTGGAPLALADAAASEDGVLAGAALASLGLRDGAGAQALGTVDTADAVFLLTHGKAGAALVYATDVVAHPALAVAATMPDDAYPPIIYWWAETRQVRSARADDFAAFLGGASARDLLGAAGLGISP